MNCLRDSNSIFSRILRRYYHHHQTSPRRRLIDLCSSLREFITHPRVRSPSSTVSPPLHLQYGTPSRRRFVLRWYHEPWKVAAATAITMAATVMAFCSRYDREIVPCTYRSHLVIYSDQELIDLGDTVFAEDIAGDPNYVILDPSDPRSVRVRHIAKKIIHAAYRGLGIYDKNDAPMLRATEKKRGKEQPHTSHLPQLNWEVILIEDDYPNAGVLPNGKFIINTGLFDWYKTDEEIAAVIAHEVSHIIARHSADINSIHGVVHDIFSHRREMEADYIGILLLGAAGFHPQWFHVMIEKAEKFERRPLCRPSPKKRLQFLSEAKTMNEALELYREVTAMDKVTGWFEIEADHIGMLVLAAAGFHPNNALKFIRKQADIDGASTVVEDFISYYPSNKRRLERLSEPEVMEKAIKLYREATPDKGTVRQAADKDFSLRETLGDTFNIISTRLREVLRARLIIEPAVGYNPLSRHL